MLDKKKSFFSLPSPEVALDVLMLAYVIKYGPYLIDSLAKELQAYIGELTNEDYAKEFENAMDTVASQRIQLLEYISDKQQLIEFVKESEYKKEQKQQ